MKLSELIEEEMRGHLPSSPYDNFTAAITARLHECVKPLEWYHGTSTGPRNVHYAETLFGRYVAWPDGAWRLFGTYHGQPACENGSLETAKAASQSHYAAQIIEGWNL